MVRLRNEGKNVRGDDGQDVQEQWNMSILAHWERSVRWCVGRCAVEFRWRKSVSFDGNGVFVAESE
jgi:hypothetical protein